MYLCLLKNTSTIVLRTLIGLGVCLFIKEVWVHFYIQHCNPLPTRWNMKSFKIHNFAILNFNKCWIFMEIVMARVFTTPFFECKLYYFFHIFVKLFHNYLIIIKFSCCMTPFKWISFPALRFMGIIWFKESLKLQAWWKTLKTNSCNRYFIVQNLTKVQVGKIIHPWQSCLQQ